MGEPIAILDPCAGQGVAIRQIADALSVASANVYAVELDESRAAAVRENLPGANVLAPCSFFGTAITPGSFSFAWVNPPFDDEIGGGERVERTFLAHATVLLRPSGVVALVCPDRVFQNSYDLRHFLLQYYTNISVTPFPEEVRKFNEVVIFGVKRKQSVKYWETDWSRESVSDRFQYQLPSSTGPRHFLKHQLTDEETARALARSPLRKLFEPVMFTPLPRAPLPPGSGHRALMVAAGHLDGVIRPPGELPHVVRGTARKESYVASEDTEVDDKGKERTITVMSERIILTVRTVDATGEIRTYE